MITKIKQRHRKFITLATGVSHIFPQGALKVPPLPLAMLLQYKYNLAEASTPST